VRLAFGKSAILPQIFPESTSAISCAGRAVLCEIWS
jgi:hypothetical protein